MCRGTPTPPPPNRPWLLGVGRCFSAATPPPQNAPPCPVHAVRCGAVRGRVVVGMCGVVGVVLHVNMTFMPSASPAGLFFPACSPPPTRGPRTPPARPGACPQLPRSPGARAAHAGVTRPPARPQPTPAGAQGPLACRQGCWVGWGGRWRGPSLWGTSATGSGALSLTRPPVQDSPGRCPARGQTRWEGDPQPRSTGTYTRAHMHTCVHTPLHTCICHSRARIHICIR